MEDQPHQLRCSGTNPRTIRAAAAFPQRLAQVHEGRISLRSDAIYHGANKPIAVICNVCNHEWKANPHNLANKKGCPACARQRNRDSAGTVRKPRASKALKAFANACHQAGMSYCAIGRLLNKSDETIRQWCNPEVRAKRNESARKWHEANREHHNAIIRRYRTQFEHGKTMRRKREAKRRALEFNSVFDVEVDGRLVEVNMFPHLRGDPEGQRLFISDADAAAYAELQKEGDKVAEETGVNQHVDHLIPLTRGGEHQAENFELKPAIENMSKGNTVDIEDSATFARRIFNITEEQQ